jgi:hypothetical protein
LNLDPPPAFCPYCGKALAPATELPPTGNFDPEVTLPPSAGGPTALGQQVPDQVGGYRLVRTLGSGGMGHVYEAIDPANGRKVALKLISGGDANALAIERFRQEGRLASRISHPRCVFVYAADEDAGRPFIVMELMPGDTLHDRVKRDGPLPVDLAVGLTLDLINGLAAAHRLGVIHRDVKPSNCFLDTDGRVKVGDFGLAKSLVAGAHLTKTGSFLGTPLFASPEQIRGDPLDERTDVYSAAATLFFMLTGRAPHESKDPAAVIARIVADDPPAVSSVRPGLSPALDEVLRRALARDRDRRYRNLSEFRDALLLFLPDQLTAGSQAMRFGAMMIDYTLISMFSSWTSLIGLNAAIPVWQRRCVVGSEIVLVMLFLTLCEFIAGATIGKWILGFRVAPVNDVGRPKLSQALRRTLGWYGLVLLPTNLLQFLLLDLLLINPIWALLQFVFLGSGIALILSPMRKRNGYRGLHELLSGTRVLRVPEPEAPRPGVDAAPETRPLPATVPAQIGPYHLKGAFASGDQFIAEDRGLGRQVLIVKRSSQLPVSDVRRQIFRPTRLRWLGEFNHGDQLWDVFVAPIGCTLIQLIKQKGRFDWQTFRPLLDELHSELVASANDGTLPESLSIDQVWIQADGRMVLLDRPLDEPASEPAGDASPAARIVGLLSQVSQVALEGWQRDLGDPEQPVRVPVPRYASATLAELTRHGDPVERLNRFRQSLKESRDRPTRATRANRAAQQALHLLFVGPFLVAFTLSLTGMGYSNLTSVQFMSLMLRDTREFREDLELVSAIETTSLLLQRQPINRLAAVPIADMDRATIERLRANEPWLESDRSARIQLLNGYAKNSLELAEKWGAHSFPRSNRPFRSFPMTRQTPNGLSVTQVPNIRNHARWTAQRNVIDPIIFNMALIVESVAIWFFPLMFVCWTFLIRIGLSFRIVGLTLVRTDSRPAGRIRCAFRTFLSWLPMGLLLWLSVYVDVIYWRGWEPSDSDAWLRWLSSIVWWLGVAAGPAGMVMTIRRPTRSILDHLSGTIVVPS